jgi:hypothetical protein
LLFTLEKISTGSGYGSHLDLNKTMSNSSNITNTSQDQSRQHFTAFKNIDDDDLLATVNARKSQVVSNKPKAISLIQKLINSPSGNNLGSAKTTSKDIDILC